MDKEKSKVVHDRANVDLMNAVRMENVAQADYAIGRAIDRGANVNVHITDIPPLKNDPSRHTALHIAAGREGGDALISRLLTQLPDVNSRDWEKSTPLHIASNAGTSKATQLLILAGADVNAKDVNGNTPLHRVAESHSSPKDIQKIVHLLVAAGANPELTNKFGETPIKHAIRNKNSIGVQAIIEATNPHLTRLPSAIHDNSFDGPSGAGVSSQNSMSSRDEHHAKER